MEEIKMIKGQPWYHLDVSRFAPIQFAPVSLRESLLKHTTEQYSEHGYGKHQLKEICGHVYWAGIVSDHQKHVAGMIFIRLVEDGKVPYELASKRTANPLKYRKKNTL